MVEFNSNDWNQETVLNDSQEKVPGEDTIPIDTVDKSAVNCFAWDGLLREKPANNQKGKKKKRKKP